MQNQNTYLCLNSEYVEYSILQLGYAMRKKLNNPTSLICIENVGKLCVLSMIKRKPIIPYRVYTPKETCVGRLKRTVPAVAICFKGRAFPYGYKSLVFLAFLIFDTVSNSY